MTKSTNKTTGNKRNANANENTNVNVAMTPNGNVDNKPTPVPAPSTDHQAPATNETTGTTETMTTTETTKRTKIKWSTINVDAPVEYGKPTMNVVRCTFPTGEKTDFNIESIFPEYDKMTDVQKFVVEYGIKQFLTDKTAFPKNEKPDVTTLITIMQTRYDDMINGKFRSNESRAKTAKIDRSKLENIIDVNMLIQMKVLIDSGIMTGYRLSDGQMGLINDTHIVNENWNIIPKPAK